MTERALDDVKVLLIDGNNVLHRIAGAADPTALRTLLPKLRAAIPETIATVLMLDGHADTGTYGRERIRRGFEIRHSGSFSADDALLRLIRDAPPTERHEMTLVSDDIALANRARMLGARTKRLAWLEQIIGDATAQNRLRSARAGALVNRPSSTANRRRGADCLGNRAGARRESTAIRRRGQKRPRRAKGPR